MKKFHLIPLLATLLAFIACEKPTMQIEWSQATGEAKTELKRKMDKLEYKQSELKQDIASISDNAGDKWITFRKSMQEKLNDLNQDMNSVIR